MLLSAPAFAHVTANPNKGSAGHYFETQLRVSHGCEGSDTVAVTVQLPTGMGAIKPQSKPGWTVEKKISAAMGGPAGQITWRGGPLKDGEYDTFGLLMKLPDTAGETLWFPVTQTCEKGEQRWSEIPADGQAWHDLKSPAPFVTIEAGGAPAPPGHHH